MKKLLLSVFAIAAMASCMQDEVISQDQQAIDFGTPFVDKATKAQDLTYSGETDLTEFKVYGTVTGTAGTVNIFNNATVSGTVGENSVWTCDVKQYWIPGANYKFAAVVDAVTVGQDLATLMPTTLVPATDADGYLKDLLYDEATAVGQESNNDEVAIVFEHLLAKAHFTVTSNTKEDDGYYHKVTGIKINNFSTGTYTINGGTWSTATATQTDKAYELGNIAKITSTTGAQTNDTQVLLYPTTTDFTVEFTVELWNSKGSNGQPALLSQVHYTSADTVQSGRKEAPILVSTDLLKGNAYNFQLGLSVGEEIKFTVAKDPEWAPTTNVPVTLQ